MAGLHGRYVRITLPGNKALSLCEVEVYGISSTHPGKNHLFKATIKQMTIDTRQLHTRPLYHFTIIVFDKVVMQKRNFNNEK